MANYLFATVGGRDVQFKKEFVNDDNLLCGTNRSGERMPTFIYPRETGKEVFNHIDRYKEKLEYPIIDPVIEYLAKNNNKPDKIFLFVSNQTPADSSDTIFIGKILAENIKLPGMVCEVKELTKDSAAFDDQYDAIYQQLSAIEQEINIFEDAVFILPQSGTPATRNALLLNCILFFPKAKQIQNPRGQKVTEQHFPQKFRDQVRIKSFPSILKETLATISARNLSHTDGSHVMISYQKNLKEKLEALKKSHLEIGFKNLKENYDAFSDYLRGQMEYIADISGQTSSHTFFDYDFELEVEIFRGLIESFLLKGLIDDLKHDGKDVGVIIDYMDSSKKISIPGGSNGINAFYTILKNFIRNLYKHSTFDKADSGYKYVIYLNIDNDDYFQDYYKVTLYDQNTFSENDLNQIITGTAERKGISQCIHDKLLNEEGVVRKYGWGILEMKIAAFYLMGLPLMYFDEPVNYKNEIDLSKKEIKQIFPNPFKVVNYKKHLAYEFYLRKPETFCVVNGIKPKNESKYQDAGVTFCSGDDKDIISNTRAKFIINNHDATCNSHKCYNIRQIDFFDGNLSNLLDKSKQHDIILTWLQKMFLEKEQSIYNFKKEDFNQDAEKSLAKETINKLKDKNLIVIDSHGNGHSELNFQQLKKQGYFYYSTKHSKDNYDIPIEELDKLRWEELEAIFTKVAVLDERIQNKVNEAQNYIHKLSKRDLLELRGVFIPGLTGDEEKSFDLRSFVFGNGINKEKVKSLESIIKEFLEEYHYVVLHFSILEKMAEIMKKNLVNYHNQLIKGLTIQDHYLVLTSGKGTPPTLPEGSYFINLSSLARAINNLSKVELVQHLNALKIYHKPKKS